MSPELLEEIRLLLNLETASEKLLQVILVGQPELEITLKRPELRQLRQRIAFRCKTAPLSLPETNRYIANRLRIAGASGHPIFAPSAVSAVHFHSRGIPRVINHLCEHSLINAYIEQCNPVQPLMVEQAARDFLLEDYRPGALPSLRDASNNGDLAIQQPIRAAEPVRPTTPEVAMNLRALEPTSPVAPAAFPVQEHREANSFRSRFRVSEISPWPRVQSVRASDPLELRTQVGNSNCTNRLQRLNLSPNMETLPLNS
jgi:hypothetical protein